MSGPWASCRFGPASLWFSLKKRVPRAQGLDLNLTASKAYCGAQNCGLRKVPKVAWSVTTWLAVGWRWSHLLVSLSPWSSRSGARDVEEPGSFLGPFLEPATPEGEKGPHFPDCPAGSSELV